jgi:putative membrane protein
MSVVDGWHRLHPLSPVARVGRLLPAVVVAVYVSLNEKHGERVGVMIFYGVIFGLSIVFGVIHWVVTRWRVDGDTLRIETGLVRRDSRRLPLSRIQAVDIVRPFTARLLGVSELRIRLAGSGSTDGRLSFLSEESAASLRQALLGGSHHRTGDDVVILPETPLASVATSRLVASVLFSFVSLLLVAAVVLLLLLESLEPKSADAVAGFLTAYLVSFAGVVWRRLTGQFHFEALEVANGLHVQRGMFSTISETIPFGRIQAVRQVQPLLWRPFGWCRLEVDIAGAGPRKQSGEGTGVVRKALLPVGRPSDALHLVTRILGEHDPDRTPPPHRARYKAPLSYHFLSAGFDDTHAVCVTGRLNRTTAWVPFEKAQSIRRVQGPAQRRLGLATVHVDVAGRRTRAEFRDRELAEADRLVDELTELSRHARRQPRQRPSSGPAPVAPPPGWYQDPSGRHEWRYFDGGVWTPHVSTRGVGSTEELGLTSP